MCIAPSGMYISTLISARSIRALDMTDRYILFDSKKYNFYNDNFFVE